MKIDSANRVVSAAVGELAAFVLPRRGGGRVAGAWRSEAGRRWHGIIQSEQAGRFAREVPVRGELRRGGWTIGLEGRCDLVSAGGGGRPPGFGEIKTVTDPLPLPGAELRARHPAYFRQLAIYRLIAAESGPAAPAPADCFLLFIDIDAGIRQTVPLAEDDLRDLEHHLATFTEFLETVAGRREGRRNLAWRGFLEHPRESQPEAAELLRRATAAARVVGFEAPTGFGKTRIVLEHALAALRDGQADRIVYLTGKTSGQEQACAEIDALFPGGGGIRAYRMRNHREHWSVCPLDGCLADQCAPPGEGGREVPLADLARGGPRPDEAWREVRSAAEACSQCPYALSKARLSLSDLWIADYNYLFAPSSRHVFLEAPGFDPARTWLLVDEAHNLSERVSSALGGRISERQLRGAAAELRARSGPPLPRKTLECLAREIDRLREGEVVSAGDAYLLIDLFESAAAALAEAPLPWRDLTEETVRTLQTLSTVPFLFERESLEPLFWRPEPGRLEWLPLRPGPWIAGSLAGFAQTVFFSATLHPFESFVAEFGLEADECAPVRIEPTGSNRFRIAIDARASTTLRNRSTHYGRTAGAIESLAAAADSCVAVFLSSYEYAEAVRTYLEAMAPHLATTLQPRDPSAAERERFAREEPLCNDVLFLMLGGSFAEAIDTFGGVVRTAMIVGPGLPEMSGLNRIRMEARPDRETGFHEVCRIPGMRRVNQAIGRFVRHADHRATIVLHDKRFLEPEYRALLRPDLGEPAIIRTDRQWRDWLAG